MATLLSILNNVAAFIDQDTTLATGMELTVRINLVNQALTEWSETYQWKQLRISPYSPSFGLSSVSMALPNNFRKIMSIPIDNSITSSNNYTQILPQDRFIKNINDKYCYITGNDAIGYALNINPALSSGVSLVFDYQSIPSSMATLQDISVCPSSEFLIKRTIAYIFQSRSDSRFPGVKSESDDMLANLIEDEASPSVGQKNSIPDYLKNQGFRIGE